MLRKQKDRGDILDYKKKKKKDFFFGKKENRKRKSVQRRSKAFDINGKGVTTIQEETKKKDK